MRIEEKISLKNELKYIRSELGVSIPLSRVRMFTRQVKKTTNNIFDNLTLYKMIITLKNGRQIFYRVDVKNISNQEWTIRDFHIV